MNSLVSYIMLLENGKMASSISPLQGLKFLSRKPFLSSANFSHSCRFIVYVLALLEMEQLTTAFITNKLKPDLNKWSICIQQVCAQSCVFYPTSVMSGLPVNQARRELECLGRICEVSDARHRLSFGQGHSRGRGQKFMGHVSCPESICREQILLLKSVITSHFSKCTNVGIIFESFLPFTSYINRTANPVGFAFKESLVFQHRWPSLPLPLPLPCQPGLSPLVCICAVVPLWSPCSSFSTQQTEGALQNTSSLLAVFGGFHLP